MSSISSNTPRDRAPEAKKGRPPRALNVVSDSSEELTAPVDWSHWYLTEEEDMGESCEQGIIIRLLLSVFEVLLRERGQPEGFLGADNFFAWREDHPQVRVSPDVYYIPDEVPEPPPDMWETWRSGHRPPSVAIEIVSKDWRKDYVEGPQKYAHLGVDELVIFDPVAASASSTGTERVPLQIYRRQADDSFVRLGLEARYLETMDIHLVVDASDAVPVLRLARDSEGTDLVPSLDEALEREIRRARDESKRAEEEAKRAEEEAKRAEEEAKRAEREAERADATERELEAAQAEIERLREQLADE